MVDLFELQTILVHSLFPKAYFNDTVSLSTRMSLRRYDLPLQGYQTTQQQQQQHCDRQSDGQVEAVALDQLLFEGEPRPLYFSR